MEVCRGKTIIATYNSIKWIDECLNSCEVSQTIVIDNASTDSTVNHIRKNYPEVIVIQNKTNIGFGQANNIGIQKALSEGAEYVFLLNQDAYSVNDCMEKLIEVHQSNPEYGILSPIHLNGDGTNLDYNFNEYIKRIDDDNLVFDLLNDKLKKVYSLPFVNAAGWLIPKSTIERVGLFDPMFFHYGEDENYCQRVRYHGLKIGIVPEAFMRHDREFRARNKMDWNRDLTLVELMLKIDLGNINLEKNFRLKRKIWFRRVIIELFKLNFSTAHLQYTKFILLKSLLPEIKRSRKLNKSNLPFL